MMKLATQVSLFIRVLSGKFCIEEEGNATGTFVYKLCVCFTIPNDHQPINLLMGLDIFILKIKKKTRLDLRQKFVKHVK